MNKPWCTLTKLKSCLGGKGILQKWCYAKFTFEKDTGCDSFVVSGGECSFQKTRELGRCYDHFVQGPIKKIEMYENKNGGDWAAAGFILTTTSRRLVFTDLLNKNIVLAGAWEGQLAKITGVTYHDHWQPEFMRFNLNDNPSWFALELEYEKQKKLIIKEDLRKEAERRRKIMEIAQAIKQKREEKIRAKN